MRCKKRLALLVLSVACFLLSLATHALGEQQPNQAQMEVQPMPNAGQVTQPIIEVPKTEPEATNPLELSPVTDYRPDIGLAETSDKTLEPYVEGRPKPTPPPANPAPKPLTETKVAELKQTNPGLISKIISATKGLIGRAVSWLGTQYIWGGISKKGVDCSGLTRLLYMSEGIRLPHSAKLQYKIGQAVAKMALLPGDLVFFNTTGPLSHVGMYIGNGKFLHAANPRRGVRVDSLNSGYFSKRFAGARRYKSFG